MDPLQCPVTIAWSEKDVTLPVADYEKTWRVSTYQMRDLFTANGLDIPEGQAATSLTEKTNISAVLTDRLT
jgi:hypothetical protein